MATLDIAKLNDRKRIGKKEAHNIAVKNFPNNIDACIASELALLFTQEKTHIRTSNGKSSVMTKCGEMKIRRSGTQHFVYCIPEEALLKRIASKYGRENTSYRIVLKANVSYLASSCAINSILLISDDEWQDHWTKEQNNRTNIA